MMMVVIVVVVIATVRVVEGRGSAIVKVKV